MLYIFLVDTGIMMPFDMSLTTETVQTLKEHVERAIRLPVSQQVMLISGGECLDSTKRVCSYPSGTDTNPIYLFSRSVQVQDLPNLQFKDLRDEEELVEKVKSSATVPPSFQIVAKRAQLAQQFADSAVNLLGLSKQLVLDQHYQHQGWAAVIANCEDLLTDFKSRFDQLEVDFREYVEKREHFKSFLEKFKESLRLLRKIPLLPKLVESYDTKKYLTETSEEISQSSSVEASTSNLKLFDWIGRDEHGDDVETKYEKCIVELNRYNEEQFNKISAEVEKILTTAGDPSMKEIKGLGPMLFQLDKFIQEAEKKVREQVDCASSIVMNQSRVQNLRDSSILPDLCASHVNQLNAMAETHKSLLNIYLACTKGKMEFNKNLSLRFPWLKHVHNAMQNLSDHMDVFSENIGNLRRQLDILEQVDVAPVAYLSCVTEIVRRRSFSQAFLRCTSKLVSRLLEIHSGEVARRKDFRSRFDGHFIHILFPGMGDQPPGYGIHPPSQFDTELPKLTQEDIEFLKSELPEMVEYLSSAEPSQSSYSSLLYMEHEKGKEETTPQIIFKDAVVQSEISEYVQKNISKAMRDTSFINIHGLPYLKDLDRGCESETDTEEFEKVGQSPLDLNFEKDLTSIAPNMQDASTLTEDNLEISRSEFDKMKSLVMQMGYLASQTMSQLKYEINNIKCSYSEDKTIISNHLQHVFNSLENLRTRQKVHDNTLINEMSSSHSNEINDFRKLIQVKNDEIKSCRSNMLFLEQKMKTINNELTERKEAAVVNEQKIKQFEKTISDLEIEKEKSIKEVTERLSREYRDEIKTLKARFKLMTMERTPSESSLEKTLEISSYTNHESIINQMTENFEMERENIVKETISKETQKWEKVIEQLNQDFEQQKSLFMTKLVEKISEEKDCQIQDLRNREKLLLDEIKHYTSTIEQLNKNEVEDLNMEMMDKIEALESEKNILASELKKMADRLDMTASVVSYPEEIGKTDSATSPIKQPKGMFKSFTVPSGKMNKFRLDYLKQGDPVVVVWDEEHESFRIAQDTRVMYFLHSDCIKSLDLEIYEGFPRRPNKFYCIGEYVHREYCHARKSKNRYQVPRGARFFQVTVKPLEHKNIPEQSSEIDIPMTQSNIASNRTLSDSTTELDFHSLPSSPKITSEIHDLSFESSSEAVHDVPSESDNSFFNADNMNFRY